MTTNPQDPQIVHPAPSTTIDLVRAEIGHLMGLVDQLRSEMEAERVAHEKAAAELVARTEEQVAHMVSEAEARVSSLLEAQLDARNSLAEAMNGIDLTLDQHSTAVGPDPAANS